MGDIHWRVAAVLLVFVVSGIGSAATYVLPGPEQIVEGHIVYTVIENVQNKSEIGPKAAAVAVLVRAKEIQRDWERFPGVLWFNDQYLVDPDSNDGGYNNTRYPCTGAVLAVNQGDLDPRSYGDVVLRTNYVESYLITDPNDHQFTVDKFNVSGSFVWSVALNGNAGGKSDVPDDGSCNRAPYRDSVGAGKNPVGYGYPCGGNGGPKCSKLLYNAVLFFMLDDLRILGLAPKNHSVGSADRNADVAACHDNGNGYFDDSWPCPAGNDDREGNSHNYNPKPNQLGNQERNTHGYSDDCTGDGFVDRDCHATRMVDIYYGIAPIPSIRVYGFKPDHVGRLAPYHCHEAPASVDYCT